MSPRPDRIVVDPIHGAIELTKIERRVIDTASFQRLRHLKQLGLGHVTYPNATHSRFAHSLGVLAVMSRVLRSTADKLKLSREQQQNLRLAALLHDIGHYPYSHLMERIGDVVLTEDLVRSAEAGQARLGLPGVTAYPGHEELGQLIVTTQRDLQRGIGGKARARQIADLFTRSSAADPQLSKLLHSSLDMDRLDYLTRDARAAGVPYGEIDVNYLLNNVRVSPTGMIGIDWTALPAAEQFLFARYFMYRTVYYHKTTFGMEETFRQLLRRCQQKDSYGVPSDGNAIRALVADPAKLIEFTDHFADAVARKALRDDDHVIRGLAEAVVHRKPPKLLREEVALVDTTQEPERKHNACASFLQACRRETTKLATGNKLPLGLFFVTQVPAIRLEKRGSLIPATEASGQPGEKEDELIKVFRGTEAEPKSLVDIPESLIKHCANRVAYIVRLYVIEYDDNRVKKLRDAVRAW